MNRYSRLKRENAELNIQEYDSGMTVLRSLPRAVFVELTKGCNLTCPMCRTERLSPSGNAMQSALFEKIADSLFPAAEVVDLRGWGESLLLPNIVKRMATVRRYGARVRIVTNLSFRRDEVLRALVEHDAQVDVSLDTSNSGLLKYLRGGARRELVFRNLELLAELGHSRRLRILVTVQRPALSSLPQLVRDVSEIGVRWITFFSVSADSDSVLSLAGSEETVDRAIRECGRIAGTKGVALTLGTKLGTSPDNPLLSPACIHPWAYCFFSSSGEMGFCDHLIGPSNQEYLVGNLRTREFGDIWNNEHMQDLRGEHLGSRRPEAYRFRHCSWCYKEKHIDFEMQLDPRLRARVVCAPGTDRIYPPML